MHKNKKTFTHKLREYEKHLIHLFTKKINMTSENKTSWTIVLSIIKYVVTLALGFVGGTASASINL